MDRLKETIKNLTSDDTETEEPSVEPIDKGNAIEGVLKGEENLKLEVKDESIPDEPEKPPNAEKPGNPNWENMDRFGKEEQAERSSKTEVTKKESFFERMKHYLQSGGSKRSLLSEYEKKKDSSKKE